MMTYAYKILPVATLLSAMFLGGCTSPAHLDKVGGAYYLNDGPPRGITKADIASINAMHEPVPKRERLVRGTLKPYTALGREYRPMTSLSPYRARGIATWYGTRYHGRQTASGEIYDLMGLTAAHPTLPIPSYVRVTNLANSRTVVVRVNDRGPFVENRLLDLSYAAAVRLGYERQGSAPVEIELLMP